MEVDFGVSKSVELVRVFEASFDVVLELLLLFMLFDFGFDVVARFIFLFKKNIEEQVLMFLDLTSCNFLFLIFI